MSTKREVLELCQQWMQDKSRGQFYYLDQLVPPFKTATLQLGASSEGKRRRKSKSNENCCPAELVIDALTHCTHCSARSTHCHSTVTAPSLPLYCHCTVTVTLLSRHPHCPADCFWKLPGLRLVISRLAFRNSVQFCCLDLCRALCTR